MPATTIAAARLQSLAENRLSNNNPPTACHWRSAGLPAVSP